MKTAQSSNLHTNIIIGCDWVDPTAAQAAAAPLVPTPNVPVNEICWNSIMHWKF
jgi:hypothetical protein